MKKGWPSASAHGVASRKPIRLRNGLTPLRRKRFLDTLAETCNVQAAVAAGGADSSSFYELRRRDAAFAAEWAAALSMGYDVVEAAVVNFVLSRGEADSAPVARGRASNAADTEGSEARGGGKERTGAGGDAMRFRPGVGSVSSAVPAWVQVGLLLLNRHREAAKGAKPGMTPKRMPTAEETDAIIAKRLDQLARSKARAAPAAPDSSQSSAA